MTVQQLDETLTDVALLRRQLTLLLSDLHLRQDEAWFTGADQVRLQAEIETLERQHAPLFCPCHLCARPTVFRDAAYELPFCWTCLQTSYHPWYRGVRYNRS